jgi:hypothetical protein
MKSDTSNVVPLVVPLFCVPLNDAEFENIFGSNDADGLALGALELGDRDRADDGHPLVAVAV